jgi:hypothetical protein
MLDAVRMAMTKKELEIIKQHYKTHTHKQIADMLGKSHHAVRNACSDRGWTKRDDSWSEEELLKLIAWYLRPEAKGKDTLSLDCLAADLGRLKSNVSRKAKALGLTNKARPVLTKSFRESMAERTSEAIKQHGHPRGSLGLKHSANTKKKIGKKSAKHWDDLKGRPVLLELRRQKQAATNIERYGTGCAAQAFNKGQNVYSRCRRGIREDLGFFVRSRWEANYARYLKWLEQRGDIAAWEYEPLTFRFDGVGRGPYTYKPDFKVVKKDGTVAFHEVKGWMDSASKGKLKRFAKFYPQHKLVVIEQKAYRSIEKTLSSVIQGWESE